MKSSVTAFFILLFCSCMFGQTLFSSSFDFFSHDLQSLHPHQSQLQKDFIEKYPVVLHNGTYYISALAVINESFSEHSVSLMGIRTGSIIGQFATLRIPVNKFNSITSIPGVDYIEVAGKISPALDKATRDSRVDSVHMGWYLPVPISGNNVIIGITDWGFDYTHPMFYDTSLTSTRILAFTLHILKLID